MPGDLTIIIDGERVTVQKTPISGDVAVTPAGASTIGTGAITTDMLSTALKQVLYPVAEVGQARVGYCQAG